MDSQPTDKVEGVGDDFVRGGQDKTPIKQKRNSFQRIVVSASTPTVKVTAENEQYIAPWTDESPGGTVTTRQKEMGDAARAAEMTKEEVALEKRKGLAEKEAARRAASGQAGKGKHAAGEAARKAATGQAGTVKRAAGDATAL